MTQRRLGLRGLLIVLTLVVPTTAALAQQPTPAASQPAVAMLDKLETFFSTSARTGTGYAATQSLLNELMQTAKQALADRRIDQQFFDRFTRVLRITLLASMPDNFEILQPITSREFSSFVRDISGKDFGGSASAQLGDLS